MDTFINPCWSSWAAAKKSARRGKAVMQPQLPPSAGRSEPARPLHTNEIVWGGATNSSEDTGDRKVGGNRSVWEGLCNPKSMLQLQRVMRGKGRDFPCTQTVNFPAKSGETDKGASRIPQYCSGSF